MKYRAINSYPKCYKNKYPLQLWKNVIKDFFKLISIEILKGYHFQLNSKLGTIKIKRQARFSKGLKVDFGKTNANKKAGIDEIVYRTNEFMDKFVWLKAPLNEDLQLFKFKATKDNNRAIPKYDEILSIKTLEVNKNPYANQIVYNRWNKENTLVQKQ